MLRRRATSIAEPPDNYWVESDAAADAWKGRELTVAFEVANGTAAYTEEVSHLGGFPRPIVARRCAGHVLIALLVHASFAALLLART
jgi:hypothetical protein